MLYTTFIQLCNEASKHADCQEFITAPVCQSHIDESSTNDTEDVLSLIFDLAGLDFPGLRKRTRVSMRKFSDLHQIPLRTIESRESATLSARNAPAYVTNLIRYTIFAAEKELGFGK